MLVVKYQELCPYGFGCMFSQAVWVCNPSTNLLVVRLLDLGQNKYISIEEYHILEACDGTWGSMLKGGCYSFNH